MAPSSSESGSDATRRFIHATQRAMAEIAFKRRLDGARQEIEEHSGQCAASRRGSAVQSLIDGIIGTGLELRYTLLQCSQEKTEYPCTFKFPSGSEGRLLETKCRIWVDQVEACFARWRRHRWTQFQASCGALRAHVAPGEHNSCPSLVGHVEELVDEIRCIIPQLEVMSVDDKRVFRDRLTGDELDHAQQLLAIEGQHEEAILRAAGVIAGVVLETHLSETLDCLNATLPNARRYTRSPKKDGLASYVGFLIGEKVIDPSERTGLTYLGFVRNCCDQAPGGNLRAPHRDEVERLISETRRYVTEIRFP